MVARLIRLLSIALCLVVAASFAMFALDEARSASQTSVSEISGKVPYGAPHGATAVQHAWPRRVIDDAAGGLETPFTELGVHSSNQWGEQGALLVLALLLYGGGLGFFARWVDSEVSVGRRKSHGEPQPPTQAFAG